MKHLTGPHEECLFCNHGYGECSCDFPPPQVFDDQTVFFPREGWTIEVHGDELRLNNYNTTWTMSIAETDDSYTGEVAILRIAARGTLQIDTECGKSTVYVSGCPEGRGDE